MARKPKSVAVSPACAAETLARIQAGGATPLDHMLQVMRDETVEPAKRLDAAKAAAPYVHPRLASLAVGNQDDRPFQQVIRCFEPPLGDAGRAAVVHDYLYATRGLEGRYSRAQADGIFRQALADLGVPPWKRLVLWAAVRLGGAHGWGR